MRIWRAAKIVIKSPRIPKPIKGLAVIAMLPIPGPLDEIIGIVVLGILAIFYRKELILAWEEAGHTE